MTIITADQARQITYQGFNSEYERIMKENLMRCIQATAGRGYHMLVFSLKDQQKFCSAGLVSWLTRLGYTAEVKDLKLRISW